MTDLQIIIASVCAIGVSLVAIGFVNSLQTRKRLIQQRLQTLKRTVAEYEELSTAISPLLGSTAVEKVIVASSIDILKGMQQLAPKDGEISLVLQSTIQRAKSLDNSGGNVSLQRAFLGDTHIAKARYQLGEAADIVRKRQIKGRLDSQDMSAMLADIAWARLMVFVVSLVAEGHKSKAKGEVLQSSSYYQKAQDAAKKAPMKDTRKTQLIDELEALLTSKRDRLSGDLMPEASVV